MFRELTPPEVYEELAGNDSAVLVDCQAPAEWHFTGIADLSGIGKTPVLVAIADETGRPNHDFVEEIKAVADPSTPVCVMCRVVGRSANACRILAEAGFTDLINMAEGFESPCGATSLGHFIFRDKRGAPTFSHRRMTLAGLARRRRATISNP